MKSLPAALLFLLFPLCWVLPAPGGEVVEIRAKLIPLDLASAKGLSRLELLLAVTKAEQDQMKPVFESICLVETGRWLSIKAGREFWFPQTYSPMELIKSPTDGRSYSIAPTGEAPGDTSYFLPPTPIQAAHRNTGLMLQVQALREEDGALRLKGSLISYLFEGFDFSGEPVTVPRAFPQKRKTVVSANRIATPIFREVETEFDTKLPRQQSDHPVLVELGDNAWDLPRERELPAEEGTEDTLGTPDDYARAEGQALPRFGILVLNANPVAFPTRETSSIPGNARLRLTSRLIRTESDSIEAIPHLVLDDAETRDLLRAISEREEGEIVSSPSLTVRSGESGKIEVSREFVFPSAFDPPAVTAEESSDPAVNPASPRAYETRNLGFSLRITGEKASGGLIRLRIGSLFREFDGFIDYGPAITAYRNTALDRVKRMNPLPRDTEFATSPNPVLLPLFPFREIETEVLLAPDDTLVLSQFFDRHLAEVERSQPLGRFRGPRVTDEEKPRGLAVLVNAALEN